jgi:nucleotide-binding universal stress UspA family protein
MNSEEKIRQLIAALNPSEKGYIKKFAKAELDEKQGAVIDALFEKVLSADSVSSTSKKNIFEEWAFDFIMNCLEEYHKNEKTEMRGILNQVDVLLVDKDLPDQAEKLILRGKKLAEKSGMTDMMMEISELETALLAIKPPSDELIQKMEKTFEDLQELCDEHDSYIFKKIKDAEK